MSNDDYRFLMTLVVDDEVHAVQSVSFGPSANPTLIAATLADIEQMFIKKHIRVNTEQVTHEQLSLFEIEEKK
jgi:hypothetical protein